VAVEKGAIGEEKAAVQKVTVIKTKKRSMRQGIERKSVISVTSTNAGD
jgi:hypothetical protein